MARRQRMNSNANGLYQDLGGDEDNAVVWIHRTLVRKVYNSSFVMDVE